MNKAVLLAVDVARREISRNMDAAVQETKAICQGTGDRVVVLHVHEFAYGRFGRLQVDCAEGEGEKVVDQIVADLRAAGVTAEGRIRAADFGHVARAILTAANECDARMVVLGSSSRTDLPHLPFGSVSTRLLHMSRRPVLIVPWKRATVYATNEELAAEVAG
jgi:nucleotide-binding universal stress UspA family protein